MPRKRSERTCEPGKQESTKLWSERSPEPAELKDRAGGESVVQQRWGDPLTPPGSVEAAELLRDE